MTVTVQVMVTSSPAVAAISDWSRVTLGGGRSGGGGGNMSVHVWDACSVAIFIGSHGDLVSGV